MLEGRGCPNELVNPINGPQLASSVAPLPHRPNPTRYIQRYPSYNLDHNLMINL